MFNKQKVKCRFNHINLRVERHEDDRIKKADLQFMVEDKECSLYKTFGDIELIGIDKAILNEEKRPSSQTVSLFDMEGHNKPFFKQAEVKVAKVLFYWLEGALFIKWTITITPADEVLVALINRLDFDVYFLAIPSQMKLEI